MGTEIGGLTALARLTLQKNLDIIGPIPTEFGKLTNLKEIRFNRNGLTGAIPSEIGTLTSLIQLDIQRNNLIGDIPEEICALFDAGTLNTLNTDLNPCS